MPCLDQVLLPQAVNSPLHVQWPDTHRCFHGKNLLKSKHCLRTYLGGCYAEYLYLERLMQSSTSRDSCYDKHEHPHSTGMKPEAATAHIDSSFKTAHWWIQGPNPKPVLLRQDMFLETLPMEHIWVLHVGTNLNLGSTLLSPSHTSPSAQAVLPITGYIALGISVKYYWY